MHPAVTWVKRVADPLRPHLRPSIIIVGAQKAGTSALFKMLARHPKVIAPTQKELTFFSNDEAYARGFSHYLEQLPLRPVRGSGWMTLDATPSYLYEPATARRIKEHLPTALIVAVLRDPVRRAHSGWNMFHQFEHHPRFAHLYERRSFSEAMEAELADPPRYGYLALGDYAPQIQRYFDLFGRERVLVFGYPAFKRDPAGVVRTILGRSGADPGLWAEEARTVRANVRRYEGAIDPALEARLRTYFAPKLKELTAVLGHELDLAEDGGVERSPTC